VAAGALHNLGLRENSTVHGWGENTHGQSSPPAGLSNVIAVAAGNVHSLALREDGTVVAWGWEEYGQTNVPPEATNIASIAAGAHHNLALRKDGVVVGWGRTNEGALLIPPDLTNVVQVAAGENLSFALLSNGTVRAWGTGALGPVTVPATLSNVVQLDAAFTHCLALKADGTVVGLGQDSGWGETIAPPGLSNVLQVAAGYYFSLALKNDGTVVAWGCSDSGQTNVPAGLGDVKQVAAGYYHALALAYSPVLNYPVNVPQDLLLIYNTNCPDSGAVMNYYRTNRPLIEAANVLGVGGATNAVERYANLLEFTNTLLAPFQQWLAENPTKQPLYIVMAYGVPATVFPTNPWPCRYDCGEPGNGVRLRSEYPNQRAFVTHLNMRTPEDCFAYVDKLRYFGTNYSPGKIYISARKGGYGNSTYYFDDIRAQPPYAMNTPGREATQGVLSAGASSNSVVYTTGASRTSISENTNVAGYLCWGYHGGFATHYTTNGQSRFFESSAWYPVMSIESFNGQWEPFDGQTSYHFWFVENAFFGQSYEFTPAGAVSHLYELRVGGVNDPYQYFGLWELGRCFARCAWISRRHVILQAIGDPFVCK
jgi:hypothetical protein